jgi:hypothetical protein
MVRELYLDLWVGGSSPIGNIFAGCRINALWVTYAIRVKLQRV